MTLTFKVLEIKIEIEKINIQNKNFAQNIFIRDSISKQANQNKYPRNCSKSFMTLNKLKNLQK